MILEALGAAMGAIATGGASLAATIGEAAGAVGGAIAEGAGAVGGAIAKGANAVGGAVESGAQAVGNFAGDAVNAVGKTGGKFLSNVWEGATTGDVIAKDAAGNFDTTATLGRLAGNHLARGGGQRKKYGELLKDFSSL
jgi:hypothetical protein